MQSDDPFLGCPQCCVTTLIPNHTTHSQLWHQPQPRRASSRRQTRRHNLQADGLHPHQQSMRKPATSTNRRRTLSNLRSYSRKPATPLPERQSAGSSARRRTRPRMPGGTLPKPTNEDSRIVSDTITQAITVWRLIIGRSRHSGAYADHRPPDEVRPLQAGC